MAPLPATPSYWLLQATEARLAAEVVGDARAKRAMVLVARGYERMAEQAARLERLHLPMDRAEVDLHDPVP
jgi:hypothetical protein